MIFIWSGWGLLTPLFGVLGFLATVQLREVIGPDQHPLCLALGGVVAGASTWIVGSFLPGRLWFIPIKFYAPIYLLVFGALAFSEAHDREQRATGGSSQAAAVANVAAISPAQAANTDQHKTDGTGSQSGAATAEAPKAAPGSSGLSWALRDEKDQMTDQSTRKAVSRGGFDDGISLEASALCDPIGVEFSFDTFHNQDAAPFAWKDNKLGMRVRIDGGEIRTATANAEYTNEATIIFYDPAATESFMQGALPHSQERNNPLLGLFNNVMTGTTLTVLQAAAAGKLKEIANAKSIRVELPLANGSAYVVELNPQDQALRTIVQPCLADLRAGIEANRQAEQQAQKRAEQERIAKVEEQRRQNELTRKRNWCAPGSEMVVNAVYGTPIRNLDEYDPRKAGRAVTTINVQDGERVRIVNETDIGPAGAKIPNDRCVVSYDAPQGRFVGTMPFIYLVSVQLYNSAHQPPPSGPSVRLGCPRGSQWDNQGNCRPINPYATFNR
jgi:hypothetical protein